MIKPPRAVEGIELVIRGDSKTVVDWIICKAKQKVSYRVRPYRYNSWNGAKWVSKEWKDESATDWTKVTGTWF